MNKVLPFKPQDVEKIIKEFPTPFHLYDEAGIRAVARKLKDAYSWSPGYKNYFAVKATPNPYILEILKEEGMGADTSSLAELLLAESVGLQGEDIMFTANNPPAEEYKKAYELGAVINLDDINQIPIMEKALNGKFPDLICFRYNPGPDIVTSNRNAIGNPSDAKFGVSTDQLSQTYKIAKQKGATRFGLHIMVASNERDAQLHAEVARLVFKVAVRLFKDEGIRLEFINLGGGLGVAYKPEDKPLDLRDLSRSIHAAYQKEIIGKGLDPIKIITENGRYVLAPNGYLITKVRSTKNTYHTFVGVDATMSDLMRPGMYGAYHHITALGKTGVPTKPQRITGSLCENNDIFTGSNDRLLPELALGDILIFHDTGAHGHSMGFNYNGKLRHAELLLQRNGHIKQIRRAETLDDYFGTLNYPALET